MFKNSLFLKILLVFTLPALGMLYFSAVLVFEKIEILNEVNNIKKTIKYISVTEKLIHSIQKERGFSTTYLTSNNYKNKLTLQREITNTQYQRYLNTVLELNHFDSSSSVNIKKVQNTFYKLDYLREKIDHSSILAFEVLENYTSINKVLLESITAINPIRYATEFNQKFSYIANLLRAKEDAGIERAITAMILGQYHFKNDIYEQLVKNYTSQEININQFFLKANISEINMYNEEIPLSLENEIINIREMIKNKTLSISIENWWRISTKRIDSIETVYDFISSEVSILVKELEKDAHLSEFLSLTFLLISFITLVSLLFVLKNIIENEQKSFSKLSKQQEIYMILNKSNKFLLKSKKINTLFSKICSIVLKSDSFSFALIYDIKKKEVISKESPLKDILTMKLEKNEDLSSHSLLYKAIHQKKNIIIENFNQQDSSILSDVASRYKLSSAAAFPIKRFNKIVAVLVLYSSKEKYFDNEIEILFDKMISDMTHALEKISYEKTRLKQENELRLASYAFESHEPMLIADADIKIIKANQAFCNIMKYGQEKFVGKNPSIFKSNHHDASFYKKMWSDIEEKGSWSGELFNKTFDGLIIPLRSTITAIKDKNGKITHYLGQYVDIAEQKDKQKILEYQATHDNLTALPNRLLLLDRVEHAITKVVRHNIVGGLVFIDLDNFKEINDTLGHEIGDKLLIKVAQVLKQTIRDEDTIARIGGDEFIILADCIGKDKTEAKENMSHLTKKVKNALNDIKTIDGHKNISTPSIGVTLFSDASIGVKDIIKQADTAMYVAKKQGKNTIEFFS